MSLRKNCSTTHRVVITGIAAMALNAFGTSAYVAEPISLFGAVTLSLRRAFTLAAWHELFRQAGVGKFHVTPLLPLRMSAWIEVAG